MAKHDIIVIGASAGGVEALSSLFRGLIPGLNAAVFVVVHIPAESKSQLPLILSRYGTIPAVHPADGQSFQPGYAYIAPPNQHMVLRQGVIRLSHGPKENGFRPAINQLFESAALVYGSRVAGVILSGNLYDGAKGLVAIKRAGGLAVVQDPEEALYPSMPSSALQYVKADYILPVVKIAGLINKMSRGELREKGDRKVADNLPDPSQPELDLIKQDIKIYETGESQTSRSVLTCPDCGGVLWEIRDDQIIRYRCHVGHAYSPETLLEIQTEALENAFWTAIRVLVEKAALANRLALRAKSNGLNDLEQHYLEQARHAERDAEVIRSAWFRKEGGMPTTSGEQANQEVTREES